MPSYSITIITGMLQKEIHRRHLPLYKKIYRTPALSLYSSKLALIRLTRYSKKFMPILHELSIFEARNRKNIILVYNTLSQFKKEYPPVAMNSSTIKNISYDYITWG